MLLINNYIKTVRNYMLKRNLMIYCYYIIIGFSFLFLLITQLESIFYFNPKIKTISIYCIISTFIALISFWFIYYLKARNNQIKHYKIENIANLLGNKLSKKKGDIILNAYQLESKAEKNESQALINSYINN